MHTFTADALVGPLRLHQRAVGRLYRLLDDACPPEFEVLHAPFAVTLAEGTVLWPDVLVGLRSEFTERSLSAAPLLAVEVLSPATRVYDTQVARGRYERAGTPAFWAVDPMAAGGARLTVWALGGDGRYRQVADVRGEEGYAGGVPFPVTVVPDALIREPAAARGRQPLAADVQIVPA